MKKLLNIFVLVAAAAMALASCQKNEIPAPEKQEVHFTINAGIPQTKTTITDNGDGTYTPSWDGTENLAVLFQLPDANTDDGDAVKFTNKTGEGATATFSAMVSADKASTETLYAIYPYEAFGRGFDGGLARLDLNSDQKPTATSFDPSCDILVARPYDYAVNDGEVVVDPLYFTRVMSVLRVNLKSDFADINNEFVESIKFQTGGVNITGYAKISVENPEFTGEWTTKNDYVTATYDSDVVSINGDDNSVYFVVAPVTIPADKNLTFTIKTKNYTITKTIEANNHPEMKFDAGNVAVINLNIKEEECTPISGGSDAEIYYEKVTSAPADWSGTYLIVFETQNYCWDGSLEGGTSTGQFGHAAGHKSVTIKDNRIEYNDSYFTIAKSGTNYSITSASGSCVGNSGTSAGLKIGDYTCSISLNDDKTVNIISSDGNTQVLYNKSASYIRFYKTSNAGSTSYGMPSLYKLIGDENDGETPAEKTLESIAVSNPKIEYTVGDGFEKPTVTATYSDNTTEDVTASTEFTGYNMAEAGTYTVVVSYSDKTTTYNITVSAAQGGGDQPVEVVTYQHIITKKPSTGSVTLSDVIWTLEATNLNNYNSQNYAGVQFGTGSKAGTIKLTSENPFTYDGKSNVKEIRLWLNNGSGTITPKVTINGVECTMTGTIVQNKSAGSDYTKASLVKFTPTQPISGIVVIDLSCNLAGYFCAMEIDVQ